MAREEFQTSKLRILSPDTDDWNDLVNEHDWLNMENSIYGVLLYPKAGIGKECVESKATDYIGENSTYSEGGLEVIVKSRKKDWAIIYHIQAWYRHFDVIEEFD